MITKRNNRKAEILNSAIMLIHEKGYAATSVDDIISTSHVHRASFYYHFKSKEELGFAVLEKQAEVFYLLIQQKLEQKGSPFEKICFALDALEAYHRERGVKKGCPFGNLVCELSATHDAFRMRLGRLFHDFQSLFAEALSPWRFDMEEGITPESLSEFIIAAIEGASLIAKVDIDVEVIARTHAHVKKYLKCSFNLE